MAIIINFLPRLNYFIFFIITCDACWYFNKFYLNLFDYLIFAWVLTFHSIVLLNLEFYLKSYLICHGQIDIYFKIYDIPNDNACIEQIFILYLIVISIFKWIAFAFIFGDIMQLLIELIKNIWDLIDLIYVWIVFFIL